jgi:hypothetical protein
VKGLKITTFSELETMTNRKKEKRKNVLLTESIKETSNQ